MRISDWSSDVCSSDLGLLNKLPGGAIFTLPGEDNAVPDFLSRYRNQTIKAGDYVRGYERLGVSQLTLRSEEHTSELQSLMRISYAVFCLKKKKNRHKYKHRIR